MVETLAAPTKALIDATQIANKIHEGVNSFMEAVPVLMRGLDDLARIHPFVSGAGPSLG